MNKKKKIKSGKISKKEKKIKLELKNLVEK